MKTISINFSLTWPSDTPPFLLHLFPPSVAARPFRLSLDPFSAPAPSPYLPFDLSSLSDQTSCLERPVRRPGGSDVDGGDAHYCCTSCGRLQSHQGEWLLHFAISRCPVNSVKIDLQSWWKFKARVYSGVPRTCINIHNTQTHTGNLSSLIGLRWIF